jgi:hypothetical protein
MTQLDFFSSPGAATPPFANLRPRPGILNKLCEKCKNECKQERHIRVITCKDFEKK